MYVWVGFINPFLEIIYKSEKLKYYEDNFIDYTINILLTLTIYRKTISTIFKIALLVMYASAL